MSTGIVLTVRVLEPFLTGSTQMNILTNGIAFAHTSHVWLVNPTFEDTQILSFLKKCTIEVHFFFCGAESLLYKHLLLHSIKTY